MDKLTIYSTNCRNLGDLRKRDDILHFLRKKKNTASTVSKKLTLPKTEYNKPNVDTMSTLTIIVQMQRDQKFYLITILNINTEIFTMIQLGTL